MHYNLNYHITIGGYQLALMQSCEVHKSVELLADTCTIKMPDAVNNVVRRVEDKIKVGDKVTVWLGYDDNLIKEFEGYLQRINTDANTIELVCEDDLFLLRKSVKDKEFKKVKVADIAAYVVKETGVALKIDATLNIDYDKFVISRATGYDVLKKLQEETKANIYIKDGVLHIHPPYSDKTGEARYAYQKNIETADLKFVRKEDKKIEVVVSNTGKDGKKKEVRYGTTGGDKEELRGDGMSDAAMKELAKNQHDRLLYDGYEGTITGWLIPYVEPTYSVEVVDEEYPEKKGWYYVVSVVTTMDESGGVRKITLGKKLAA